MIIINSKSLRIIKLQSFSRHTFEMKIQKTKKKRIELFSPKIISRGYLERINTVIRSFLMK